MKNSTGIILGVALTLVATLLGILITFNIPIEYTHSEVIYYPKEDKTYLEICRVKQKLGDYIIKDGVFTDKEVLDFNKIELEVK